MPLSQTDVQSTYRRVYPLLLRKCERMLKDRAEAEDTAQEAFTRLWRDRAALAALNDPRALTAWLYRTSTRLAVDRFRDLARQAQPSDELADAVTAASGPEARASARSSLSRLLAQIPGDELEMAVLSRVDGLTQPEIAQVLGCGERTVRRALSRLEERLTRLRAEGEAA